MLNISRRYDQNSSSLELEGMPDVSSGDSNETIGIISSWTLKIIGFPLLEGKKEHLENLMQVIVNYSRSYISGIKKSYTSTEKIVSLLPFESKHKLLLKSTQKNVKPLEIILDDSELFDLTRCLDILRYDQQVNIKWNIDIDKPYPKRYITKNVYRQNNLFSFIYALTSFAIVGTLLTFIPISNVELLNTDKIESTSSEN